MFNDGDRVFDIDSKEVFTVLEAEYQNGWYYLVKRANGEVAYRAEYEIKTLI